MRRLRAIAAVLRAAAGLDRQQGAELLTRPCDAPDAPRAAEDELGEGRSKSRDFGAGSSWCAYDFLTNTPKRPATQPTHSPCRCLRSRAVGHLITHAYAHGHANGLVSASQTSPSVKDDPFLAFKVGQDRIKWWNWHPRTTGHHAQLYRWRRLDRRRTIALRNCIGSPCRTRRTGLSGIGALRHAANASPEITSRASAPGR